MPRRSAEPRPLTGAGDVEGLLTSVRLFGSNRLSSAGPDRARLGSARSDSVRLGSAMSGWAGLPGPSLSPAPPTPAGSGGTWPPAAGGRRRPGTAARPSAEPPASSSATVRFQSESGCVHPPPPHPGRSLGVVPLPPRATWGHPEACRPPRCNSKSAAGPPVPCFARFSRGGKPAVPKEHPPAPSGDGTVRPMASALGRARGWVPDHPLAKQPRASQNKQSRRRCFSNHPCEFGVTSRALPGWLEKPSRGCAR